MPQALACLKFCSNFNRGPFGWEVGRKVPESKIAGQCTFCLHRASYAGSCFVFREHGTDTLKLALCICNLHLLWQITTSKLTDLATLVVACHVFKALPSWRPFATAHEVAAHNFTRLCHLEDPLLWHMRWQLTTSRLSASELGTILWAHGLFGSLWATLG